MKQSFIMCVEQSSLLDEKISRCSWIFDENGAKLHKRLARKRGPLCQVNYGLSLIFKVEVFCKMTGGVLE
jgi:hypothetical protein